MPISSASIESSPTPSVSKSGALSSISAGVRCSRSNASIRSCLISSFKESIFEQVLGDVLFDSVSHAACREGRWCILKGEPLDPDRLEHVHTDPERARRHVIPTHLFCKSGWIAIHQDRDNRYSRVQR